MGPFLTCRDTKSKPFKWKLFVYVYSCCEDEDLCVCVCAHEHMILKIFHRGLLYDFSVMCILFMYCCKHVRTRPRYFFIHSNYNVTILVT